MIISFLLCVEYVFQEQLIGGLHLIDFEQLKINNVDLNEKIEERNDEILKLKKKVTSTVEVLTHVKEKLQFLQVRTRIKICEQFIKRGLIVRQIMQRKRRS